MDIAPTAKGIVRPDLLDYSDNNEHAFMCQATLSDTYQPISFYSISEQQTKKQKKPQPHETSSCNSLSYLTSHNS